MNIFPISYDVLPILQLKDRHTPTHAVADMYSFPKSNGKNIKIIQFLYCTTFFLMGAEAHCERGDRGILLGEIAYTGTHTQCCVVAVCCFYRLGECVFS